MTVIKDGAGTGYSTKVDSLNRLHTTSVVQSAWNFALSRGKAFSISTGVIALTSADESALIYISFNEAVGVVLEEVVVTIGNSTNGSGDVLTNAYVVPTAGTVISDAVAITPVNLNQSSAVELNATAYSGGEGKTLTGETFTVPGITKADFENKPGKGAFLARGASFGTSVFPPVGNTSLNVVLTYYVYIPEDV